MNDYSMFIVRGSSFQNTRFNRWLMLTINAVPVIKFSLSEVGRD